MSGDISRQACEFSKQAHSGQLRKGTEIPYFTHLEETADIVRGLTDQKEIIAAAYLHDIVEDTDCSIEDVRNVFGDAVAHIVEGETERREPGYNASETWQQRKTDKIKHLKEAGREVQMVALADKLSNMRATYREYERIGDEVWKRFNRTEKEVHAWYYKELSEAFSKWKDTKEWKEFDELRKKIFEN